MHRKQKITFVIVISFITLWGCASRYKERGINDSQAPITGSSMTSEWIAYNEKSQNEKLPQLVYLSMSLEFKNKSPKYLTDKFTLNDNKTTIFTKWKNINANDEYKLDIIDPRDKLFDTWKLKAKESNKTGIWWYSFYIKDAPASKLPGKWNVKIYMNDRFVTKKDFIIGQSYATYKKIVSPQNNPSIMITPFLHEGKRSATFSLTIPTLISQNLSIQYPEFNIVNPYTVTDELASPPEYEKPSNYIKKALMSKLIHSLLSKHNTKMVITGYFNNPDMYNQKVKYNIFIIDAGSKDIRKEIKCYIVPRSGKNWDAFMVEGANKIYNIINEEGSNEINTILNKK